MWGGINKRYWNKPNWWPQSSVVWIKSQLSWVTWWFKNRVAWLTTSVFYLNRINFCIISNPSWIYLVNDQTWESYKIIWKWNKEDFLLLWNKPYGIVINNADKKQVILMDLEAQKRVSDETIKNLSLDYSWLQAFAKYYRLSGNWFKKINWELLESYTVNDKKLIHNKGGVLKSIKIKTTWVILVAFRNISLITDSGNEYIYMETEDWIWKWITISDIEVV